MKLYKERPNYCGYYYIFPKDRDDQLDNTPEIAYIYFDGRHQLFRIHDRPYPNNTKFGDIEYWYGPIEDPEWPEEIKEWLSRGEE